MGESSVTLSADAFVTTDEVREYVFSHPEELERTDSELNALYRMINGVCAAIAILNHAPILETAETQVEDGGSPYIFLDYAPIASVESVTEDGVTLDEDTDYLVDLSRGLVRRNATVQANFNTGQSNIVVEYTVGFATAPEDYKLAALRWLDYIWRTGPANYTSDTSGSGFARGVPQEILAIINARVPSRPWVE